MVSIYRIGGTLVTLLLLIGVLGVLSAGASFFGGGVSFIILIFVVIIGVLFLIKSLSL